MKEKTKVDSKRFGRLLYTLAYESTYDELKDEKIFKDLGVGEIDRNYLFTEMLIIKFFSIILTIDGGLGDEKLENDILDSMHEAYYIKLKDKGGLDQAKIIAMKSHILKRYIEYTNTMEEKKGQNWLLPLACYMVSNLRKEKTTNIVYVTTLAVVFSSFMDQVLKLIGHCDIVRNK